MSGRWIRPGLDQGATQKHIRTRSTIRCKKYGQAEHFCTHGQLIRRFDWRRGRFGGNGAFFNDSQHLSCFYECARVDYAPIYVP